MVRGDTHMTPTLRRKGRGGGGEGTNEMLSDVGGGGSKCSGRPIFFFLKENWICAITRHHAEPTIALFGN